MHETPQSGTWLFCFQAQVDEDENSFHVANRTYSGDGITIPLNLRFYKVEPGTPVDFFCRLDDDEADVCNTSAEDKSDGSFKATPRGSRTYNFDNWSYTVY